MANLEQFRSRIPDTQSVKLIFSLEVAIYLTKTERKPKISNTALIILLLVKIPFSIKNVDFLSKKC